MFRRLTSGRLASEGRESVRTGKQVGAADEEVEPSAEGGAMGEGGAVREGRYCWRRRCHRHGRYRKYRGADNTVDSAANDIGLSEGKP